jgi:tubulin polyglutamylase TTLL4
MWRNIARLKSKFGDDYNIAPLSFVLPEENGKFQMERDQGDPKKGLWILKPSASSCGRGIKIIGRKTIINDRTNYVASRYIAKPHLLNGFKYDLRIYVLVTSYDPLRVYVYKDGLVRFATQKYSNNPKSLK